MCFGLEADEPGLEWISPCKCRGATKWVHQLCLQQWVDEKQKGASSMDVSCPQCKYEYQIVYPDSSFLLYIYEHVNNIISSCSPVILTGVTASTLYWISFTYGYTTTAIALGRERSLLFESQESLPVLLILPVLPWVLLGFKLLRLELLILKSWYRLAPTFHVLMDKLSVNCFGQHSVEQFSFVPAPVPVFRFLSRSIVSTFFLPFISSSVGWFLSFFLRSTSSLKRTILVNTFPIASHANHFKIIFHFQGGFSYILISYTIKIWIEHHRGSLERRQ